jgi:hypothetical protein
LNNGSGDFSDSGQRLSTALAFAVAIGDVDRDGDLDVSSVTTAAWGRPIAVAQSPQRAARVTMFFVPRDSVDLADGLATMFIRCRCALGERDWPATKGGAFSSAAIGYRPTVGITNNTFTYTVRARTIAPIRRR